MIIVVLRTDSISVGLNFGLFNLSAARNKPLKKKTLSPRVNRSDPPPFWEMDEYKFQDLCCALLHEEPDIAHCNVYGTRGQKQDGIDLLAHRTGGQDVDVGQCKCYKEFQPAQIEGASNEFFDHLLYWQSRNIRRFILLVACELRTRQRQNKVLDQKKEFSDRGLEYEAWDGRTLVTKLGRHRHIVNLFLGADWIDKLCGPPALPQPEDAGKSDNRENVNSAFLVSQLNELAERVDRNVSGEINTLRTEARNGRADTVLRRLSDIQCDGTVWSALSAENKAKVLRLQGSLLLGREKDIASAINLADQADQYHVNENSLVLRAHIAWRQQGPDAAIQTLKTVQTKDGLNLRAAAYLELNDPDHALADLSIALAQEEDSESYRLKALAYLLKGQLDHARAAIDKAIHIDPTGRLVRLTLPMISFYECLSPAAPTLRSPLFPNPVDWSWVKKDAESLGKLRHAQNLLRTLIEEGNLEDGEAEKASLWLLSCFSIDAEKQDEAEELCNKILNVRRTDVGALAWASARNFQVNFKRSQKALEVLIDENKADIPHYLALATCYLHFRNRRKSLSLLDNSKALFELEGLADLWLLWRTQLDAFTGQGEVSVLVTELRSHEAQVAQAIALSTNGKDQRARAQLKKMVSVNAGKEGDLSLFYTCCEYLAHQGEWAFIYQFSSQLVHQIGTEDAIRMAAFSAYHTGHTKETIELLDDNRSVFANTDLPYDLYGLHIKAHRKLGHLNEAIAEAEDRVRISQDAPSLLGLADLYLARGDIHGFAREAEKAVATGKLATEQTIHLARLARIAAPLTAQNIAHSILKQGVPNGLEAVTYDLLTKLGMDEHAEPYLRAMIQGADSHTNGVRAVTQEELIEYLRKNAEQQKNFYNSYRRGDIPVHIFATLSGITLANAFFGALQTAIEKSPPPLFKIPKSFMRYGGRAVPRNYPDSSGDWSIYIDCSSLMLAEAIGLLDVVEDTFESLRVSPYTTVAFAQMCDEILPHQPARIKILQDVRKYITDTEEIGVLSHVKSLDEIDAIFLDWSSSSLSKEKCVNIRALLETILASGSLSKGQYKQVLENSESEIQNEPSSVYPVAGSKLVCLSGTIEALERLRLIHSVSRVFELYVMQEENERLIEEIRDAELKQEISNWLQRLNARLSEGIQNNKYIVLPEAPFTRENESAELDTIPQKHTEQTLFHLLNIKRTERAILWIDDRVVSANVDANGNPLAGITDILGGLLHYGRISETEYFGFIHKLRLCGQFFIPLEKDELLHCLNSAPYYEGRVRETPELKILRQYFSRCWIDGDELQKPPTEDHIPNKNGEISFIVSHHRAAVDAIAGVWSSTSIPPEQAAAYSSWIWEGLSVMRYPGVPIGDASDDNKKTFLVLIASSLLVAGLNIGREAGRGANPRRNYLEWVNTRILKRLAGVFPGFLEKVVENLSTYFLGLKFADEETEVNEQTEVVYKQLMRNFIDDFPEHLQGLIWKNDSVINALEIIVGRVVSFGEWSFQAESFWNAAQLACAGETSTIEHLDNAKRYKVFQDGMEDSAPVIVIEAENEDNDVNMTRCRVVDPLNSVFLPSRNERFKALVAAKIWHDVPHDELQVLMQECAGEDNPTKRFDCVDEICKGSALNFYKKLYEQLSKTGKFAFSDLKLESARSYRNFLRFPADMGGEKISVILNTSAQALIQEFGLMAAVNRLSGLPCVLPEAVISSVKNLSVREKEEFFQKWNGDMHSPISRAHWLHAAFASSYNAPNDIKEIALQLLSKDPGGDESEAFLEILHWVQDSFGSSRELSTLPLPERTAYEWSHAHQLFVSFMSSDAPIDWIREVFQSNQEPLSPEILRFDLSRSKDYSRYRNLPPEVLRLQAVGYAFLACLNSSVIDEEIIGAFRKLALSKDSDQKMLRLSLLRDTRRVPDALNSFLSLPKEKTFSPFLGKEIIENLKPEKIDQILQTALDDIDRGPDHELYDIAWLYLDAYIWNQDPGSHNCKQLGRAAKNFAFEKIAKRNVDYALHALRFLSGQLCFLNNSELETLMNQKLLMAASIISDSNMDETEIEQRKKHILDIAYLQSLVEENPHETADKFANILKNISKNWPAIIPDIRRMVQRMCEELPFEWTAGLWDLNYYLRLMDE